MLQLTVVLLGKLQLGIVELLHLNLATVNVDDATVPTSNGSRKPYPLRSWTCRSRGSKQIVIAPRATLELRLAESGVLVLQAQFWDHVSRHPLRLGSSREVGRGAENGHGVGTRDCSNRALAPRLRGPQRP